MMHAGFVPVVAGVAELLALGLGFLGFVLVMTAAFVVALLVLARVMVRRVRRDRRVGKVALVMQMHGASSAPRRALAACRLRLYEAVTGATAAVDLLHAHGGPRGQLAQLTRRFAQSAGMFDTQLRLMQSEPHDAIIHGMTGPATARVAEFEAMARQIRHTACALLGGELDITVAALAADVEREIAALQAGVEALRALQIGETGVAITASGLNAAPPASVAARGSLR